MFDRRTSQPGMANELAGFGGAPLGRPMDRGSRGAGWPLVILLTVLYALSFLDRTILLLLVGPLTKELHLGDNQVAVLFGLSFGVVYVLAGLPVAHRLDSGKRLWIVAAGVVIWSASTVGSAFASNYPVLVLGRAGVAIGEAVLTPAAVSLIADMFPYGKRTLPVAVYSSVGVLMPAGAFVVGAGAVGLASSWSTAAGIAPWRLTLLLVGFPGLILGPVALLFREPTRTIETTTHEDYAPVAAAWRYVNDRRRLWGMLFLAMCLSVTASSAMVTWTSTLLVRAFGMTIANAGYVFGLSGVVGAAGGMTFWPWLVNTLVRNGKRDALVFTLGLGMTSFCSFVFCIGLAPNPVLLLLAVCAAMFCMSTTALLPTLIISAAAPARVRARLTAGSLLASGLIGLASGSSLTAFLATHLFTGNHALGFSMSMIAIFLVPLILLTIRVALPAFVMALNEIESPCGRQG